MVCGCCHDDQSDAGDAEDTLNPLTGQQLMQQDLSFNRKSSFAHKLIDVGLLAANVAQLKVLLTSEPVDGQFYHVTLVFIILSFICQVAFIPCIIGALIIDGKLAECYAEDQINAEEANSNKNETEMAELNKNGKTDRKTAREERARLRKIKRLKNQLLWLNVAGLVLVLLVVVLNIFITGLGFGGRNKDYSEKVGETKYIGIVNGTLQVLN